MQIRILELINFQSHKKTRIDFIEGFNCIVGHSRSGKSSIVRALSFVLFDDWSDSYIRNGSKYAQVSIVTDSGLRIDRKKGPDVNTIDVSYPDGKGQQFEKFGVTAPIEVKKLLGVYPAVIDSDYDVNLNLSDQDSPIFLLLDSAPLKTKFLNRLTGLHIIDASIRDVNKDRLRASSDIKQLTETLIDLAKRVAKYGELDRYSELVNKNTSIVLKLESKIERIQKLIAHTAELEVINQKETQLKAFLNWFNKHVQVLTDLLDKVALFTDIKTVLHIEDSIRVFTATFNVLVNEERELKLKYSACPVCNNVWKP